jgi:hypothetical protein
LGFVLYFFANATLASFVTAYEAFVVPVLAASPIFLLVPVPEAPVLTGLLIELPRGLAVAAMGYALFFRGDKKHKSNREAELG